MRKNCHFILTGSRLYVIAFASLGIIASLVLGKIEIVLCLSGHLLPPECCFLLHGFAPVIGIVILNAVLAHLFFRVVIGVETEIFKEDDSLPEPDNKQHWFYSRINPITFTNYFISRTEHSPPPMSFLLI